ncbi:activator of Hsp90 ATPase [Gilbertella persicaria]|uniref:activator of Hsp90 ATPase n=1 Tax=Gilbertella persicaria TaxID=101096 RepID=UPI0022204CFD|nr:activator of Hsp90 ATPase [Gilbertella persicaria]KAI8047404.1 activator of Hsp90 ATPase [Gilbertella persicaria]
MADMRNVNNWHLVNKDCRPWAKDYWNKQIVGLSVQEKKILVSITSLDECTGDVDLNQRKGKLLAIYDMALKFGWQGQSSNGSKVFGTIQVPEVAYDTDKEDYVFSIIVNNNQEADEVKKLIRSQLVPMMRDKFARFTIDLVQNYSSDLYTNTSPKPEIVKKKPVATMPHYETKKEEKVVKTTRLDLSYKLRGVASNDLYETLLDSRRADIWTLGPSQVSKKSGSEFRFFDGNVHGKIVRLVPGEMIVQTWRLKHWPKDHYSTVTLLFRQDMEGTTIQVDQKDVPLGQEDIIRKNWIQYYWKSIEACYYQNQFESIHDTSLPWLEYNVFNNPMTIISIAVLIIAMIALTAYQVAPTLKL